MIDMLILIAVVAVLALAFVAASRGWIPLPEGGHWVRRERTPREVGRGFVVLLREPLTLAVAAGIVVGLVARSFGVATPGPFGIIIAIVLTAVAFQMADVDRRRALYAWAACMAVASLITFPMIRPPVTAAPTAPAVTPAPGAAPVAPAPGGAPAAAPTPVPVAPVQPVAVVRDEWVLLGGEMVNWVGGRAAILEVADPHVRRTATATTIAMRVTPREAGRDVVWWSIDTDNTFLVTPDGTWLALRDARGVGLIRGWEGMVRAAPRSMTDMPMAITLIFPAVPAATTEADILLNWRCVSAIGWECDRGVANQRRARVQLGPAPAPVPTPAPRAPRP